MWLSGIARTHAFNLMWTCKQCGETVEDQFDSCWKCQLPQGQTPPPGTPRRRRLTYKYFRSTTAGWSELFDEAAAFASEVGRDQVLNISHSCDDFDGVVTVWYWTTEIVPP